MQKIVVETDTHTRLAKGAVIAHGTKVTHSEAECWKPWKIVEYVPNNNRIRSVKKK